MNTTTTTTGYTRKENDMSYWTLIWGDNGNLLYQEEHPTAAEAREAAKELVHTNTTWPAYRTWTVSDERYPEN